MSKLICVVDMQYDFVLPGGALPVPEAEWLLLPIIKYLADNKDEAYIVYTQDTHDPESYPGSEEAKHFPPHCYEGTKGHELLVPLNWANDIVQKSVFDMWAEGNPFDFGPEDFDSVEIVGVAADFCVKYAYEGFVKRGFKNVKVLSNLTVGINENPFE